MIQLNPKTKEAYQLFQDGALALARCEQHGMRVDTKYIKKQQKKIDAHILDLENKFKKTSLYKRWEKSTSSPINIYSDKQLAHFLYEVDGQKVEKKTKTGNASVGTEALQGLALPDLEDYLKIGKYKTLKDTFLAGLAREAVNGVVHPFFHLHLARTYRGSSSAVNFQNQPKRDPEQMKIIRGAIFPSKGNQLLELDYGQLEVRIATCFHKDPRMLHEVETGHDFHMDLAKEIFKIKKYDKEVPGHKVARGAAKNGFVFPQFYGDYYAGCSEYLACHWMGLSKHDTWKKGEGVAFGKKHIADHLIKKGITELGLVTSVNGERDWDSETGFTKHIKQIEKRFWEERYPVYAQWKKDWYEAYLKDGYFYNKTGFTYQGIMAKNDVINYPVQGSAFHVLLLSLILIDKAMKRDRMKTRIMGQIHDAIVFDVHPKELKKVIRIAKCVMENDVRQHFPWIITPLEIDAELCGVDQPWSAKIDFDIK